MNTEDMLNFDILITGMGEQFRAYVISAPGGDADTLFDLSESLNLSTGSRFSDSDAATLAAMKAYGEQLFRKLFQGTVHDVFVRSLAIAEGNGKGLRIRLRFGPDSARAATIPWELLYDPERRSFLCVQAATPIVRYLSQPTSGLSLHVQPPLHMLAVLSSPTSLPTLDLEQEWQAIQCALSILLAGDQFTLDRLESPTTAALADYLLTHAVHVLHFVGHGFVDPTTHSAALILETESGAPYQVEGRELTLLLQNHRPLRLVFLNACAGALTVDRDAFTGVAQTLVQAGLPAAIAMQAEITDDSAAELARIFYTGIAVGQPVDLAITHARSVLAADGDPAWAIPVLFSRSPDNRLFDMRAVLPRPALPYPGLQSYRPQDQSIFYGRTHIVNRITDALQRQPFLAIIGLSGSGKSSLLQAGLLPTLQYGTLTIEPWRCHLIRPRSHPIAALAGALEIPFDALTADNFEDIDLIRLLPEHPLPTLIAVDQFEEIFTQCQPEEARRFQQLLGQLAKLPNYAVLIAVRAEYYPDLMQSPLWTAIEANTLNLRPLNREELRDAIVQPALAVGVTIDEGLVERLLADSRVDDGEPSLLPLIQQTLQTLWPLMESRRLTLSHYEQLQKRYGDEGQSGSVLQKILASSADTVFRNLSDAAKPLAIRLFLRLVHIEARATVRRYQPLTSWLDSVQEPALAQQVLDDLLTPRLIVLDHDPITNERLVDIAHEILIDGWPRLQSWIADYGPAEETRRRYEARVETWTRYGQGDVGLFHPAELGDVETWAASSEAQIVGVSSNLQSLILASQNAADPGWHLGGALGLLIAGLSAVSLVPLALLFSGHSLLPATLQQAVWLYYGLIALLIAIGLRQMRKARRHWLKQWSHVVAAKRPVQTLLTVATASIVLLWLFWGSGVIQAEAQCEELGYTLPQVGEIHMAVVNRFADPNGVRLFTTRMTTTISAWQVNEERARQCRRFFTHTIRLEAEVPDAESGERTITASADDASNRQLPSITVIDSGSCQSYRLLADKALQEWNLSALRIDEEAKLPGPQSCAPYLLNEDALTAYNRGDHERAINLAQQAIAASAQEGIEFVAAYETLGKALSAGGRHDAAITALRKAIALVAEPPSYLYGNLAFACLSAHDWSCAAENYGTMFELPTATIKDRIRAASGLSIAYRETARYEEARSILAEAQAFIVGAGLDSTDYAQSVAKNQAIVAWLEQKFAEAETLFNQAITLSDHFDEEILYYQGLLAERRSDLEEACQIFRQHAQLPTSGLIDEAQRRADGQERRVRLGCAN